MSISLLSLGGEAVQPQPHIPAANQSTQTGGGEGAPERTLMFGLRPADNTLLCKTWEREDNLSTFIESLTFGFKAGVQVLWSAKDNKFKEI